MKGAYYNEIDPYAAEWLRNLISAGHIAAGDVDERSIVEVCPDDLRGYTQCHFFAGIGVWSYAARLAGWPDDRPIWTGSCPCQPFSAAGKGGGFDDERHLWPAFFHLIRECRPGVVLGEQVASKDGLAWLDLVCDDMEGESYAIGAVDTSSAISGAPHIRQRLRFAAIRLADASGTGFQERVGNCGVPRKAPCPESRQAADARRIVSGLAEPNGAGLQPGRTSAAPARHGHSVDTNGCPGWMADASHDRPQGRVLRRPDAERQAFDGLSGRDGAIGRTGPVNGFWRDADWLFCRDGKWRPVRPGSFPLAHGAASRVGRLRAYGNAVDAEATRVFVEAVIEAKGEIHERT